MTSWRCFDPATQVLTLTLHVQPGAKRTEVAGLHGDALKIKLAAPPVEGRANAELLKFIAASLSVPLKQVALKRGERSRRKVVEVSGPNSLLKNAPGSIVSPSRPKPESSKLLMSWILGSASRPRNDDTKSGSGDFQQTAKRIF